MLLGIRYQVSKYITAHQTSPLYPDLTLLFHLCCNIHHPIMSTWDQMLLLVH